MSDQKLSSNDFLSSEGFMSMKLNWNLESNHWSWPRHLYQHFHGFFPLVVKRWWWKAHKLQSNTLYWIEIQGTFDQQTRFACFVIICGTIWEMLDDRHHPWDIVFFRKSGSSNWKSQKLFTGKSKSFIHGYISKAQLLVSLDIILRTIFRDWPQINKMWPTLVLNMNCHVDIYVKNFGGTQDEWAVTIVNWTLGIALTLVNAPRAKAPLGCIYQGQCTPKSSITYNYRSFILLLPRKLQNIPIHYHSECMHTSSITPQHCKSPKITTNYHKSQQITSHIKLHMQMLRDYRIE